MSRRSCLLRNKILQLALRPKGGKEKNPVSRWSLGLSVDEAASKLYPRSRDGVSPGKHFNRQMKRAKEQANTAMKTWIGIGVR